ncbi:hypothetical protein Peur_003731 [Populus x canadensis]
MFGSSYVRVSGLGHTRGLGKEGAAAAMHVRELYAWFLNFKADRQVLLNENRKKRAAAGAWKRDKGNVSIVRLAGFG